MNVYIEGDKTGFNSISAIDKFKHHVKNVNSTDDLNKYIKSDYEIKLFDKSIDTLKYTILKKPVEKPQFNKKELFNAKLKLLADRRTNVNIKKLSTNKDIVPNEVRDAYIKLTKSTSTPIPEPVEILKNPEQYKPLILQVLKSNLNNQNKYYLDYFKLLAKHVGLTDIKPPLIRQPPIDIMKTHLTTIDDNNASTESDGDVN
jgi:hypothetical protein